MNAGSPTINRGEPNLLIGGGDGDRTHDPELAKLVLSQLSYAPTLRHNHGHVSQKHFTHFLWGRKGGRCKMNS